MNKKIVLGLMVTLACFDCSASSENNKFKMALIGGTTLVVGAAASYKAWEYYRTQSAVVGASDDDKGTAQSMYSNVVNVAESMTEKVAQSEDEMWYTELNIGGATAATGNDDHVSSALDSVHELLINMSDTQKNHGQRLLVLELSSVVPARAFSVQSSPVGQIDETSSWSGNQLGKVSSHDSLDAIAIPETDPTKNYVSGQFSGMDQSTFN